MRTSALEADTYPVDPRSDEELLEIVEDFVLRARRVLAHSLAADEDALDALAGGAWFAEQKDGTVNLQRLLPNEEALESLAARVRPMTLQKDQVHYDRVLNALSSLLISCQHNELATWCKELKALWKSVDPSKGKTTYFLSWTDGGADEPPEEMTDAALALAWFYGDLVHADKEQLKAGEKFGIDQRFAAAAVRTAQLTILTRDTLDFIGYLANQDIITVSTAALEETEVQVIGKTLTLTGIHRGDVGADPGKVGDPLDPSWKRMEGAWLGDKDGKWIMRIPWGRET